MTRIAIIGLCLAFIFRGASSNDLSAEEPTFLPDQIEFFETKIRPLLADHCLECHGAEISESGLRLDSRDAILAGGESEQPAAVPGAAETSLLLQSVRHESDYDMPPAGPLAEEEVSDLANWIELGMPWPAANAEISKATVSEKIASHREQHWAFQPIGSFLSNDLHVGDVTVNRAPADEGTAENESEIGLTPLDKILLKKLQSSGLSFSPAADKRTLIRRATFDLVGLPPTSKQVDAFINDADPQAYEKLIERLLASPQYGERWARHWLDVARYSDTSGYAFAKDRNYPFAYTYRDYVIDAFNQDLAYDQFIREQLAADYLEVPDDQHTLAALGFITVGRKFIKREDVIDDQVDVVTRGLMGLTVACARCHDHKYDAIPTEDYYSLYGVFENCHTPETLPLLGDEKTRQEQTEFFAELERRRKALSDFEAEFKSQLESDKEKKLVDILDEIQKARWEELKEAIKQQESATPQIRRAMALRENETPHNERVMIRGNQGNRGDEVPRQFVALLSGEGRQPFTNRAGRLELAEAIASPNNPLTARVIVNRIWMYHFSRPLVDTPSDFGIRCEPPLQLELLDYLATDFLAHDWSIKDLHRTMMLSHAYKQSSVDHEQGLATDPENQRWWKMNRRRLEFEALRDSMLAVNGSLDLQQHGPAIDFFRSAESNRRAIYGKIDRQDLPNLLRAFDIASPDQSSPQRTRTVIPQQSLFLLNNSFMIQQSRRLAGLTASLTSDQTSMETLIDSNTESNTEANTEARIKQMYEVVFQRQPSKLEIEIATEFLTTVQQDLASQPDADTKNDQPLTEWEQLAQVLMCTLEFEFID